MKGRSMSEGTKITWSLGYTANLGNFQSLRIDVSVTDHARGSETAKDASERVYRFVEEELEKKVQEAKETFD